MATIPGPDQPGTDPLTLGPVTFTSRQAPSKLDLGAGDQMIVDTKITGGTRIVQSFGAFYKNVRFTGTFWENAASQYAMLDALRTAGTTTTLSWGTQRFNCVVVDLTPGIRNAWRYDFEVEVLVINPIGPAPAAAATIDQQVGTAATNASNAYTTITTLDASASLTIAPGLISALNAAILAASPLASSAGTSAANTVLGAVSALSTAVNTYLGTLTSMSPSYAPAVIMLNALGNIAKNVTVGQAPASVQVLGSNYFEQAVLAYGDLDLGLQLADANNAPSVRVSNSVVANINLPPLSSQAAA